MKKWNRLVVAVCVSLVAMLAAAGASGGDRADRRTAVQASAASIAANQAITRTVYLPAVVSPAPPPDVFGVELHQVSDAGGLGRMAEAGTDWVRRNRVWWPDVEPEPGQYNWDSLAGLEAEFRAASERGVELVLIVMGTPTWAQKVPGVPCGPIKREAFTAFGDFLHQLVHRYSVPPYNVRYWEIGNEPDVPAFGDGIWFGCWGDPSDPYYGGGHYGEMLKVVYPRIKQADSGAKVVMGGLLLDCDPRNASPGAGCQTSFAAVPPLFLKGILESGAGASFDGVSYHAYDYSFIGLGEYGYYSPNWKSASNTTGPALLAKAGYIRELLDAYGATGKFLMATEVAVLNSTGEMTKAYYLARAYAGAKSIGLLANVWFSVTGWPGRNTALLTPDLQPLPAYTAFAAASARLRGAVFERQLTAGDLGGASGVQGYQFDRHGRRVWVVWSLDETVHAVALPAMPAGVWDVLGAAAAPSTTITLAPPDWLVAYIEW